MEDPNPKTDRPTKIKARELRDAIRAAWINVPPPDWNDFIVDDVDTVDAKSYLLNRRAADVDLFGPAISQDAPLIYFSAAAAHYFIQAYLLYMIDMEKLLPNWCGDMPAVHLVSYLSNRKRAYPPFSREQIACIVELLKLVLKYPKFYCCDYLGAAGIAKAISRWEAAA